MSFFLNGTKKKSYLESTCLVKYLSWLKEGSLIIGKIENDEDRLSRAMKGLIRQDH